MAVYFTAVCKHKGSELGFVKLTIIFLHKFYYDPNHPEGLGLVAKLV